MKILFGYCVICIFVLKVQSSPQITKLFPVKELAAIHERINEIKPLDKFLGKLRATYNFVFNKAEDTSNVKKILANNDAPNPDVDTIKLILANVIGPLPTDSKQNKESTADVGRVFETGNEKQNAISSGTETSGSADNNAGEIGTESAKDDWLDGIEAPKPLAQLELQGDSDDDSIVESTTPSTLQLPMAVGKQLLDWLGNLLGLTYGAYIRVAHAVKS